MSELVQELNGKSGGISGITYAVSTGYNFFFSHAIVLAI